MKLSSLFSIGITLAYFRALGKNQAAKERLAISVTYSDKSCEIFEDKPKIPKELFSL